MINAIVVGGGLGGLGLVRSLAPHAIICHLVAKGRNSAEMWSRFCRPIAVDSLHGDALISSLLRIRHQFDDNPVLLISDELAALTISEHRHEIESYFHFHMPPHDVVMSLYNKADFHRLAQRRSWSTPTTLVLRNVDDLDEINTMRFPAVAKPADKTLFHLGRGMGVAFVAGPMEAVAACRQLLSEGHEAVLQSWVPGSDDNIYFTLFHCADPGNPSAFFAGRKLAISPPKIGATAVCIPAPEVATDLRKNTEHVLQDVGYIGVGGIEFKWDEANQQFVIIEPTVARVDMQHEIAALCGINIALSSLRYEIGLPPLKTAPRKVAWRSNFLDAPADLPENHRKLVIYDGYLRSNDPMPGLVAYFRRLAIAGQKMLKRLFARVM
jgi:predicted ATP-grasp superfamily ATP-dependent carboligase